MAPEPDRRESLRKLQELIEDIRVAMLTTIAFDGSLRSHPMVTQDPKVEFDGAHSESTNAGPPSER